MSLDNEHNGENGFSVLSDEQIVEDYNAFIESITELITDYYGLELYVKTSDCEESCENAFIVKNEDKSCWLELNVKLIVVNQNCDGVEIESVAGNDQTKKQTTSIRINKEKFDSYEDAYDCIDNMLAGMSNKKKMKQLENDSLQDFNNFGRGNNLFAYDMSETAAEKPGTICNPLYIYGDAGVGKTHLLHAISLRMRDCHPGSSILWLTGEQFVNGYIKSLASGNPSNYVEKLLEADAILIDDIDYLQYKECSQELLCNLICERMLSNKQFVATSHVPLSDLEFTQSGITNRFISGIVVKIPQMDHDTRIAALKIMLKSKGLSISDGAFDYITSQPDVNGWELTGCVNMIVAYKSITHREPDFDMIKNIFKFRALNDDIARGIDKNEYEQG